MKTILSLLFTIPFFSNLFAQPANDEPCSATAIDVNTTCNYSTFDNSGATNSTGTPNPGCASFSGEDVWFSFVVPANGIVSINSNSGGITDGGMAVYSGNCSSLSLIECDDDDSENTNMPKIVLNALTPGETLYIRFWSVGGGTGNFSLCISTQPECGTSPAAGNTCETATPICDLNGYCGNTSGSYTDNSWTNGGVFGIGGNGLDGVFCGTIENNSFLTYVASSTSISFDVWVTSSTDGYGIQILIFQADGACSGEVTQYGPCYNPGIVEPGAVTIEATGLTVGDTYYIMIDGNAGDICDYVISANSGFNLPVSIDPTSATVCAGEPITLNASGGDGTYTWDDSPDLNTTTGASVIATPTGAGVFTYTVNSSTGNVLCPSSESATATITVDNCGGCSVITNNNGPFCGTAGTMNLTATPVGNATYSWTGPNGFTSSEQNPTNIPVPSTIGNHAYSVTVDSAGIICSSTTHVIVYEMPTIDAGATTSICEMDSTLLSASGADTYEWDNGLGLNNDFFVEPITTTLYTVTGTDINGCIGTDTVTVIVNEIPIVDAGPDLTICEGSTAVLSANGADNYDWGIGISDGDVVSPSADQTYIVIGTTAAGCINTDTITITVVPSPTIDFFATPVSGYSPLVVDFTNNSFDASNYNWNFGNGDGTNVANTDSQTTTYNAPGTYIVTLTASAGSCSIDDTLHITVFPHNPPIVIPPNVFTPNGDLTNDEYFIYHENVSSIEVQIINRWGHIMAEYNTLDGFWDGTSKGKPALQGTYFYTFMATGNNGEKIEGHGHLELIRE